MDINKYVKLKIGKVNVGVDSAVTIDLMKGNRYIRMLKNLFVNKFSLFILLIDYSGNLKFYLTKPRSNKVKINGGTYWIKEEFIKKTSTRYNLIAYNEGNPIPREFSHESSKDITSKQLSDFLDSELVGMALRFRKKEPFNFMLWLIIGGALIVATLMVLQFTGVVDIVSFFVVRK